MKPAVFFDRDGTLIKERHHLSKIEQVEVLPGAVEAIRRVNRSGFHAVVVTNQSAVARGILTERELGEIHDTIMVHFEIRGAKINAIYYCPHHPEEGLPPLRQNCQCRKPAPGMLFKASRDLEICLSESALIGDTLSDIEAGRRVGLRTLLVTSGYGTIELKKLQNLTPSERRRAEPDQIVSGVLEGVEWILASGLGQELLFNQ